jgi:hypothetical protein
MNTLNAQTENILNLENNLIELLSENNQNLVAIASTIKGNSISYIKEYFSKSSGLVNNYFVRLGYSNENAIQHDFEMITSKVSKEIVLNSLKDDFTKEDILKAFNELLLSLEKRTSSDEFKAELLAQNDATMNRSKGQTDAFTYLAKGVSMHNETKQIYIIGLEMNKTFVEKRIDVKPTNSKVNTIIKRKIEKLLNFRQAKIRRFTFEETQISLQGLKIQA